MTKNKKPIRQTGDSEIEACVLTPTGRFKPVGCITNNELDDSKKAMSEVVRFFRQIDEYKGDKQKEELLINKMLAEVINHGFEVGLIVDYLTFKATPRTRPSLLLPDNKAVIKSFVNTIGLTRFSEYFQNEWKKAQSVTYYFGSVRFVVGANPRDPIDTLIDLLDELDDRRSALKDGEVLAGHHMMHLRSVLMEYSRVKVVPALNELIQMSDVADKTCSGCEFVKKLIDRIGLDNLPPKTRELYKQVFSLN